MTPIKPMLHSENKTNGHLVDLEVAAITVVAATVMGVGLFFRGRSNVPLSLMRPFYGKESAYVIRPLLVCLNPVSDASVDNQTFKELGRIVSSTFPRHFEIKEKVGDSLTTSSPSPTKETVIGVGAGEGGVFIKAFKEFIDKIPLIEKEGTHKIDLEIPKDDPIREEVTPEIVGHQSDYLVSGTNLEGFLTKPFAEHQSHFVEKCQKEGIISLETADRLQKLFQGFQEIPTFQKEEKRKELAQKIANAIRDLNPGESYDMQGGWDEKISGGEFSGHALIYRFKKTSEGVYDVYIYNTGAGVEKYHAKRVVIEGVKKKTLICPYVKYQGVESERLGITGEEAHLEFFLRLIEINQALGKVDSPADIYESRDAFGAFHDKLTREKPNVSSYVTPQRSGTCSYRVLKARSRSEFESVEEFKRYNLVLKYMDFLILFEKSFPLRPDVKILLERQGRKLLLSLEKHTNLFSKEEITKASDKINTILDQIVTSAEGNLSIDISKAGLDKKKILPIKLDRIQITTPTRGNAVDQDDYREIVVEPVTLLNLKDRLIKIEKAKDSQVRIYAIEKLARELLEFTKEDLGNIPKEEVSSLINSMHGLFSDYIDTHSQEFLKSQVARNTTWSLIGVSYDLACRIVPALENYRIDETILIRDAERELYQEYSKVEWESLRKIIARLVEHPDKPRIFNFLNYLEIEKKDKNSYPPEWKWLEEDYLKKKGPVSFADRLKVLIKEEGFEGEDGKAIVQLRDMVYDAYHTCPSTQVGRNREKFGSVEKSFYIEGGRNVIKALNFEKSSDRKWLDIWGSNQKAYPYTTFNKENCVLISPHKYALSPDIHPAVVCNKALRCSKLVYHFSVNPISLKDPEVQKKFFQFLFQTGGEDLEPPIFEAIKDRAFQKQLLDFLEQGPQFFKKTRLIGKEDVIGGLFFARLARRLQELDPSLPLPSFEGQINTWVGMSGLSREEKKLVHLHRILQYKGISPDQLSKKQLQEIGTSWILCKDYVFKENGDGKFQKEEAFRLIRFLTPQLKSLSNEELDRSLADALEKPVEEISTAVSQRSSGVSYKKWNVNIVSGQVEKEEEVLDLGSHKNLQEYPLYVQIFGKMDTDQIKQGNTYEFIDDKTGEYFRYIEGNHNKDLQVSYQGEWYEYQNPSYKGDEFLPAFITSDCYLFAKNDTRVFLDKNTRKVNFHLTKDRELFDLRTGNKVAAWQNVKFPLLSSFEPRYWRLHEEDKEGQGQIRFPRFLTGSGNELCLVESKDKQFVLSEDPNFSLINPIKGLFEIEQGVLYFQHQKNKEIKILVPERNSFGAEKDTIAPKNFLGFEDAEPIGAMTEREENQIQMHNDGGFETGKKDTFLEYAYREGKIFPKDRTAQAFLSYLYLGLKKEQEALIVLDGLGRERALGEREVKILSIMCNVDAKVNQTPAGIAVSLKAGLMLCRIGAWKGDKLTPWLERYRDTYNNIPAELRLSSREIAEVNILCPSARIKEKAVSRKTTQPLWRIKPRQLLQDFYYVTKEQMTAFNALYTRLKEASTEKEKNLIMAESSIDNLPDAFKTVIILVKEAKVPLPALPVISKDTLELGNEIYAYRDWMDVFRSPPFNVPMYDLPIAKRAYNIDQNLARGVPLRSLDQALKEVRVPSYSSRPVFRKKEAPPLDLQNRFVKPYFRKVAPLKREKVLPLQLPSNVSSLYEKPLKRAVKEVNKEILLGQELNAKETSFLLREPRDLKILRQKLTAELSTLQTSLVAAKEDILSLARKLPQDRARVEKTSRLERGGFLPKIEFQQLITCYLRGSYEGLNPHLKKEEIEELDLRLKDFLEKATDAKQIERSLKVEDSGQMGQLLDAKMAYTPTQDKMDRLFLVYEYRANLRIRPSQVDSIRNMLTKPDGVLQMMMGGGKTTVLTSILLEMVEPGKIALYIPPDAQFDTQVANLSEMQHKNYSKHIIPMRFARGELSVKKLEWMKQKFADAANHQEAIVATATTLESLQLEWVYLLDKDPSTHSPDEQKKISLLTDLLRSLKKNGAILLDEVDQILDLFKELNFPIGEKESIHSHYIDLMEDVFQLHLDPKIEESLGLTRNEQSSFSIEEYKDKILPEIAIRLFDQYKGQFGLHEGNKHAFMQYVLKGEENPSFRSLLEGRLSNEDPKVQKSAQLVFLTKGLFYHLLPFVLTKGGNKDFGIPKGAEDRRVIPFLGVDSPASTEFAGPYEAACYHNLTALFSPITEKQLHKIAVQFVERASPIIQFTSKELHETGEYKTFYALTGASLDDIYNGSPVITQNAIERLKRDPQKRLKLEKEFIRQHVGAHTSYYRSNPHSLCGLVPSRKGLTGTPWNYRTYLQELRENIIREEGVEGRIRSEILQRSDQGVSQIYFTPKADVKKTLESGLESNPRKESVRALLDPVGVFKDQPNEVVAEQILTHFANDPKIQAVLFYGRLGEDLGVPGTLKVLRKSTEAGGGFLCETIGGTRPDVLKDKGIEPETTFTYYDERHCEATDIPQIPNAVGLVLVNSQLLDRDLLQTDLRLRGYLKNQDVDLILHENERKNYPKDVTSRDVLAQTEVAQEIRSADEGFAAAIQQTDNLFRQNAYEELLVDPTYETMQAVRETFVVHQDLSPYAVFGQKSELGSPLEAFCQHRKKKEAQFSDLLYRKVTVGLNSLEAEVRKNSENFPSLVPLSSSTMGMQMEISVQKEVTTEVTSEIELEYRGYQEGADRWEFWEGKNPKMMTPKELLENKQVHYQRPYDQLFSGFQFILSENFAFTETGLLPVFSKKQRSADQILIVENEKGLTATLLSVKEGEAYKKKIKDGLENSWLYLPDGEMHIQPVKDNLPKDKEKFNKILLEVNLFNGNSKYLLEHKEEFFSKINSIKDKDLLFRFLELKSIQDFSQKGALQMLIKLYKERV